MRPLLLSLALLATACHPLAGWNPSKLPTSGPRAVESSDARYPSSALEILYDDDGVPHIYGETEADRSYGLGWVHGRDRIFQISFRKYGSQGRLAELLNDEKWLSADQFLRMKVYGLEAWEASLTPRDRALMESYAAGVNDGAAEAGYTSAEIALLGYQWETFTVRDALSITRALMDDQSSGALNHELTVLRVENRLKENDPRRAELLADIGLMAPPVVATSEQYKLDEMRPEPEPAPATDVEPGVEPVEPAPASAPAPKAAAPRFDGAHRELALAALSETLGESNSWLVAADRTTTGRPFLSNDPHMDHSGPGLWEYVHVQAPDGSYTAGGSLAGAGPVIFIGYSDKAAWGATNATVDCQDLVRVFPAPGKEETHYVLDGAAVAYGEVKQRYKLGRDDDAEVFEEVWKTTVFGPLTPPGWDFRFDEGDGPFAFQWCAFEPAQRGDMFGAIMDYGRAETPEDVFRLTDQFSAVPFNVPFALASGEIVYSMSGVMPKRPEGARYDRPRDGRSRADNWDGFVDVKLKPRSVNPAKGYVNASNQRIVEEDHPMNSQLGFRGDRGSRATRISQRLDALLADGRKASPEALFAIQKDVRSVHAERVAPALAAVCPDEVKGVAAGDLKALCDALRAFNFEFTVDSREALVFEWVYEDFREEVLRATFGDEVLELKRPGMRDATIFHVNFERLVLREAEGEETATLDDISTPAHEGIAGFLRRSIPRTIARLRERLGGPGAWRWGAVHRLEFDNPLRGAPVLGWLFSTKPSEQPGCPTCVRAEYNTPITFGSALRLYADVGDGGEKRMVIDSGNSGHYGHPHVNNQHARWTNHEPFNVALPRAEVEKRLYGWVKVRPRAAPAK